MAHAAHEYDSIEEAQEHVSYPIYVPNELPTGYKIRQVLVKDDEEAGSYTLSYENEERDPGEELIIDSAPSQMGDESGLIDEIETLSSEYSVNNQKAVFGVDEQHSPTLTRLVFTDTTGISYLITAPLTKDEILQITESMFSEQ